MHKGIAVSPGVAVGVAHRVESVYAPTEPQYLDSIQDIQGELERFDAAVARSAAELEQMVQKLTAQIGQDEANIFVSHLTLLRDAGMHDRVRARIREQRLTALSALHEVLQEYAAVFARLQHEHFRERLADVRDVVGRISMHLSRQDMQPEAHARNGEANTSEPTSSGGNGHDPLILIANEILPSQAMSLGDMPIGGIVTETGGSTSHAAILSRSRGIPAVSGCVGITENVQNGDTVIVDGREGVVLVRPDHETLSAYRKVQREFFLLKDQLVLNRDKPAVSSDGVQVELLANINNVADAQAGQQVGATGVGLFRTEYLFITHPDVPDEEEQFEYYSKVIQASPGPVTIRTLDLGGDKTVPYLGHRHEPNPFMGWRSIRMAFEHPRLFEIQIRAILRAGRLGKVNMLFPMITTLDELRYVNRLVDQARIGLRKDRIPFGEDVKTGVMIEVPAAAFCIDAILRETDFISIGSNDLIQYLVAADRDNPKVAHLCEPLSPAVFKVLHMVIEAARRTGTPVTLCGEMAGQPRSVLTLFGMGLRRFSMSPAFIPTIKALLASVSTPTAERFAHHVLQLKTSDEIRAYLNGRLQEVSKDLQLLEFN